MKLGKPIYLGSTATVHGAKQPLGVLLANLGSPQSPTAAGLRPYLRQFLSDPRVIEFPRWLWFVILNGIIVPWRSPRSAKAYREVWTKAGSPLVVISNRQRDKISDILGDDVVVELGMSYGQPAIGSALRNLHAANCRKIVVVPLYPQYAASTIGAVFDAVADELKQWRWVPELRFVAGYCSQPSYIKVLADSITRHEQEHGQPQLTVFSFHGTQLAALEQGDPYHCQCHLTARLVAQHLGWEDKRWLVTFQSRFGRDPWLQPFTVEEMARLPKRGIKNIQVVCPAFAADCLETLEEICGENQEAFLHAGGEKFSYIPALNDSEDHIAFLVKLIQTQIRDWEEPRPPIIAKDKIDKIKQLTTGVQQPD